MASGRNKTDKFTVIVAILAAATVVAGLAFISPELSFLAAGFFAAVGFVFADIRRRRFWENSVSFKMQVIAKDHSTLSEKIARTGHDVMNLREDISNTVRKIAGIEERVDTLQAEGKPGGPPIPRRALVNEDPVRPKTVKPSEPLAVRPGTPQNPPPVSNDDDFEGLSDVVVRELVNHAVKNRSIEMFVQPIVRLPQRRVRFYEVYARVRARPGLYLPASRYMALAQKDKTAPEIEVLLLGECLDILRNSAHVERAAPLFVNITEATLRNAGFMKRLLTFVSGSRHLAPRLVLEIPEKDFKDLPPALLEILRGLGTIGCSVSLDNVSSLAFDTAELQRFHVRFLKINAAKLLPFTRSDRERAGITRLKRNLESNGIGIIVNKIESESALLELLDFDIHYGQGHLFGRPDLEAAYRKKRAA